ncbi:hypothetical protein [Actinophytocola sp. KF-1]
MNEYESAPATRRPGVVTAAAVLLYVFGGFSIIAAMILFGSGLVTTGLGTALTLFVLALAITYLVLATMILGGSNGARVTTIVLLSVSVALNLISFDSGSVVSIGLALLVIGLLAWNRDAQAYFAVRR